jgi:hypothetical protein
VILIEPLVTARSSEEIVGKHLELFMCLLRLDKRINIFYAYEMKNTQIKHFFRSGIVVPLLMISLLLAGFIVASFHNHHSETPTDNCLFCSFQVSYSATAIEPISDSQVFEKPLLDRLVAFNESKTDPSQKLVCSSHAPPQYSSF